jgi:hydroxypyruvate reductase/glycerate 2-kinase
MKATREIIHLLTRADEETLVLCLVSGGGSALLVSPYEGLDLGAKQEVTDLLLRAGADITELNTVRKHLSRVKGGRLAEIAYPAELISLIISDVIGDKLDVIASGPTAPDSSTFPDALGIIRKYEIEQKIPENVMNLVNKGLKGLIPETPKQGSRVFEKVHNIIIGNNHKALIAAKETAESLGCESKITSSDITGEARDIGKGLADKAKQIKDSLSRGPREAICLISGGETTVTVKGKGKGGRNTELALSFAKEIKGLQGITLLSAGTDGTDGPTDAAGAVVDGNTVTEAKSLGLDPDVYLKRNDSYTFFKQIDSLLITGPTGTNVMDVQILLISAG